MIMIVLGYAAALGIGLSLGLVGGGGSILTVPILVYLFHIDPVQATTYSLFVVGLTSLAGTYSHGRKGNIQYRTALIFGVPSLVTVFIMRKWVMPAIPVHIATLGTWTISKSFLLMIIFALLMVFASISMIRNKQPVERVSEDPGLFGQLALQGMLVGLVMGFVGVGGGFLIIPSLVLLAGLPMKKAVGTSLLIMTASSLLGVMGDVTGKTSIDYTFLGIFSALAIAGILIGSHLSSLIQDTRLKPIFGWFVLIMGIYIFIHTI
jgi:uncharacterized membrane protein YfcA